jgi:hypothetical protein
LKWSIVEMSAPILGHAIKGTNLAVYGNTLHALTAGVHYTTPVKQYACP